LFFGHDRKKVLVKLLQKLAVSKGRAFGSKRHRLLPVRGQVSPFEQIFLTSVEIFLAQVQGIFGDGGKGLPKRTNVGAVQRAFFWFFFCAYSRQKKNEAKVFVLLHGRGGVSAAGLLGARGVFGALPQTPPKNFLKKVFGTFKNFLVFRPSRK
jgi:hypothetical protein